MKTQRFNPNAILSWARREGRAIELTLKKEPPTERSAELYRRLLNVEEQLKTLQKTLNELSGQTLQERTSTDVTARTPCPDNKTKTALRRNSGGTE